MTVNVFDVVLVSHALIGVAECGVSRNTEIVRTGGVQCAARHRGWLATPTERGRLRVVLVTAGRVRHAATVVGIRSSVRPTRAAAPRAAVGSGISRACNTRRLAVAQEIDRLTRLAKLRPRIAATTRNDTTAVVGVRGGSWPTRAAAPRAAVGNGISRARNTRRLAVA
jgi:hypothetical protein